MQEQKLLYIVGWFTEYGFRTYDACSVFTDYDDAKHCLKKALLNSYSGNGWKIYKVHSSHFIPTEKENDDGLHNFDLIKSIMIDKGITGACKWFDNDEFREFGDVYVQYYWSYDLKKKTATLHIKSTATIMIHRENFLLPAFLGKVSLSILYNLSFRVFMGMCRLNFI